jgi:precorrin-6A/cobalt-precorrin-6A reductase
MERSSDGLARSMAESPKKILILGGTREAAELAAELAGKGHDVTTSLAGRTKEPAPLAGKVRTGGFGGAEGLAAFLKAGGYDLLIDATHPFAERISTNARAAADMAGVTLEVRTRMPWKREAGDRWIEVGSLEEARDAIPPGARVLLALGSQHIAPFAERGDVRFVVRMVDAPESPLSLPDHALVHGKPGTTAEEEAELLTRYAITHLVCRNSGGTGAHAKIVAARNLGLPVIIVSR